MHFIKNLHKMQPLLLNLTLCGRNLTKNINMSKILRVIDPFFTVEIGDTFVLSEDGKSYIAERSEEFHTAKDDNSDLVSSFKSSFSISTKWAKQLIEDGYLEEATELENTKSFVNVFDEIDTLLNKYQAELGKLPDTMAGKPECLKVERATVLSNMIKLLTHLKSLRK